MGFTILLNFRNELIWCVIKILHISTFLLRTYVQLLSGNYSGRPLGWRPLYNSYRFAIYCAALLVYSLWIGQLPVEEIGNCGSIRSCTLVYVYVYVMHYSLYTTDWDHYRLSCHFSLSSCLSFVWTSSCSAGSESS